MIQFFLTQHLAQGILGGKIQLTIMWYRFCVESTPLDTTKTQTIPSGGELEVEIVGGVPFMGPNDPPKQISIKTDAGQTKSIWLVHGTEDGQLVFGEPGKLEYGSAAEFKKWMQSKGAVLPYVSCFGNKIVGTDGGAGQLINATGSVNVGEKTLPDGTKKIVFQ